MSGIGLVILVSLAAGQGHAEPLRITMLADSLTAGYGLGPGQGLVPQLQVWLNARDAGVELINAGVSGDTTAGGLARLNWTLADVPAALIVELGANDMLRGIDPSEVRTNIALILQRAVQKGLPVLLIGFQAPANFGPLYKAEFDRIYPELSEEYETLLMPSFFAALAESGATNAAVRFLQADGLHPNPEGVERLVSALGPLVLKLAITAR